MNNNEKIIVVKPFKEILAAALTDNNIKIKQLEDLLIDKEITNITLKRLSEYQLGISTPPFFKAKKILNVLNYNMEDDELDRSLSENRRLIREEREMVRRYNKDYEYEEIAEKELKIKIKLSDIGDNDNTQILKSIIEERARETTGEEGENAINVYITKLIELDLEKNILQEDEHE